ncbi:oligosaccharide flippase family protein [Paraburkholderia sp. JPY419]|uniref:oligosaccharide flippase family protein n=1 Tax=Paraburkholderia sp. JPY419 TaxID=667660 RepID=UPI003D1A994A
MNFGVLQLARKGAVQLLAAGMMGVLTLAQIAFLSRHFGYRQLGIVSTQLLVVSIFTTFCDFGWEGFIIQERGTRRRVALILGSALPRMIGFAAVVDLVIALALRKLGVAETAWVTLLLVAPALPFVVLVGALQGFAVRALDIERLAISEVFSKLVGVAVTVGTAWHFDSLNCVVIGFICTIGAKFVLMSSFQLDTLKVMLVSVTRRARATRLYYYMGTQLTGQLFNILGGKADELIVASTMSLEIFGIYASIKQLVVQGTSFASLLIRRFTMPYFSRDRLSDRPRADKTISVFVWSNAAYITFFLTLAIGSRLVTQSVLGPRFLVHADMLIQFAVLWSFQTFAGATMSAYQQSTGSPFKALAWMSIQVIVQLAVMWATISLGLEKMLSWASVSYAAMALSYHLWFFREEAGLTTAQVFRRILSPVLFYYALAAAIIWALRSLLLPNVFEIVGAAIFVGAVAVFSLRERNSALMIVHGASGSGLRQR